MTPAPSYTLTPLSDTFDSPLLDERKGGRSGVREVNDLLVWVEIIVMTDADMYTTSKRLWKGLNSGDLKARFVDKGLLVLICFDRRHVAVSGSGFFLSLEGSHVLPIPPHPCDVLVYDTDRHDAFCLVKWMDQDGSKNKNQGATLCARIDDAVLWRRLKVLLL